MEDRVLDLAKGLRDHFEPDTPHTPLSEWLFLATELGKVFASLDSSKESDVSPGAGS